MTSVAYVLVANKHAFVSMREISSSHQTMNLNSQTMSNSKSRYNLRAVKLKTTKSKRAEDVVIVTALDKLITSVAMLLVGYSFR